MPNRYWLTAIAFGLALSFQTLAQEQLNEPPLEPSPAQQQADERPAIEAEPIISEIAPVETISSEHPAQNDSLFFGDGWAQWVMAITGVAALLLSAWAVWLLKRTLDATHAAVKSADDAVDVTRQIGQIQVRAYVAIGNITVHDFQDGKSPRITYKIKNVGQSPALEYQNISTIRIVGDPNIDRLKFVGPKWVGPKMDLLPGAESSQETKWPEQFAKAIEPVINGDCHLVFYGLARYRTVFGKRCWIVFRTYLRPSDLKDGTAKLAPTNRNNRSN